MGSGPAQQAMRSEGSDPANPPKQTFELNLYKKVPAASNENIPVQNMNKSETESKKPKQKNRKYKNKTDKMAIGAFFSRSPTLAAGWTVPGLS